MLGLEMDVAELNDLIARAQQKDASAFDVLVERYGSRLYGYFYRATGRRADAEDLLQDLFVRLVSTIGQYEHDGRFDAWLFRIATNLVRDRIRRARTWRESRRLDADTSALEDGLPGRLEIMRSGPHESLGREEELDRLQWAIGQLPEAERTVVLLRHFSEMPFREIADLMGTPLGTALARAHRGLARLRELMETDATQADRSVGAD
ncbi:MAG: sigma-70 family RNA polymerase sigma factor [Planctomycetes bacterium]|nr:sigma-70 family RNA polymerase sigma factor [Planctomycetota bacterium]